MDYNEPRTLWPQDIAALGVELDRNLRIARQRLVQLRADPTVTRDQARTGVEFFAMVRDQNEEFTASIRGEGLLVLFDSSLPGADWRAQCLKAHVQQNSYRVTTEKWQLEKKVSLIVHRFTAGT